MISLSRDERLKEKHLEKLIGENITVTPVNFDTMMKLLEVCDNLSEKKLVSRIDKEAEDSEVGFWSLIRGIVPGSD